MKRIGIISLACSAIAMVVTVGVSLATPVINGATIETRTFNDCPLSTLSTSNNYPASINITDAMDTLCVGFANLHSFSLSADGGTTAAEFDNDANFHVAADFKIEGPGQGEGGLRVSPWYGKFVDGRMMANATTGEIACFGGAIPFYSFTVNHGIHYVKGTTIHMEITYIANDLTPANPATIQYRVVYNSTTYDSPVLPFGSQNTGECHIGAVYNGLWGMLNDGRVGGYFQPRANTGALLSATWSNVTYQCLSPKGTPSANAATIQLRTFNDCPISTVTSTNNYPSLVEITDAMDTLCVGFANLHSFSFSEDGGATSAEFNNPNNFHFGADFKIDGAGEGEGGLRLSPWYGQYVDGRMMANATTGEIACFGGAIPFYSFTVNHGLHYVKGTTIHLEITYAANDLTPANPATIQYRVIYNSTTYDSPVLPFGSQNPNECSVGAVYHAMWGILNDARAGGYFQPRANSGASLTARWTNITYGNDDRACNRPPDCSAAAASPSVLWPPNHKYHSIDIAGVTDPDGDPVTINVTSITQDEPINGGGDGNTCPDGLIAGGQGSVRAERTGLGNGRVYVLHFTATDPNGGSCEGAVTVCVPHDQGDASCVDDGQKYNSLGPCSAGDGVAAETVTGYGFKVASLTGKTAALEFAVPINADVEITAFDVAGRRVATIERAHFAAGVYQRSWNMGGIPNGMYFVRMRTGGAVLTKTVLKAQ